MQTSSLGVYGHEKALEDEDEDKRWKEHDHIFPSQISLLRQTEAAIEAENQKQKERGHRWLCQTYPLEDDG